MGRKPIFLDMEKLYQDVGMIVENEPFMLDFHAFLRYACTNKITLTPKLKFIPMKHLYAINSLFQHPQKLDDKIGDKIYKTREEPNAPRIYFIDLVAEASDCIVPDNKDILAPGPIYERFIRSSGITKNRWITLSWYYGVDWDGWFPSGDFGKCLQDNAPRLLQYLEEWKNKRALIHFKKEAGRIIKELKLEWIAPSQDRAIENMVWGIKECILEPLSFFDIISLRYDEPDSYGYKEIKGFYVKPMGTIFIDEILKIGEQIKENRPL